MLGSRMICYRRLPPPPPPPPPKPLNTFLSSDPMSAKPPLTFCAALGFRALLDVHLDDLCCSSSGRTIGCAILVIGLGNASVLRADLRLGLDKPEAALRMLAGDAVLGDSMIGMSAMSVLIGNTARDAFGV